MEDIIKILPNFKKFNNYIENVKNKISPIMLSGLNDSGKIHLAYATHFYSNKPICIITYNELQARKLIKDLKYYEQNIEYFPKREISAFDYVAESKEIPYSRIETLNKIYNKKAEIIVTTIEAIMQKMISKKSLYKNIIKLKLQENYELEKIKEKLINLGYERSDSVDGRGKFSIRGGILDISLDNEEGARIEFWGDEIDSIRTFDYLTQRSKEMIEKITIYPATEMVLEKNIENIISKIEDKEDKELIKTGEYVNKIDKYFNKFYDETQNLIDYLDNDYIIFLDEISKIKARTENIKKDNENLIKSIIERQKYVPEALQCMAEYLEIMEEVDEKQNIYLERQDIGFIDTKTMHAKRNGYSFSYREVNFFRSSISSCIEEIQEGIKKQKTIIILGGSEENCKKLKNIFNEKDIDTSKITIKQGAMSTGFDCSDFNLLLITGEELFSSIATKRRISSQEFKEGKRVVFADLKIGDYIVHKTHGIGKFIGVNTIKADNIVKDYIKIQYKDDDILYIPTNQLDNIRKYIGTGDKEPKLNRLGSKEWQTAKSKVKSNLQEVAKNLIELYAKRQKEVGYAFSKDTEWQRQFEDNFEYTETDDQLRCIQEMKKDMESNKPMDRLLCGDVGYGKTEVAIRGAFKACMDQKQVAYLVPTTILANQQYDTFKERMKEFPIKIELLNRFKTKKEQENIVKKLKLGEIDIVIGTHRLLSKDVNFKNLGLLIIDEEHRFGVRDKEKIKELKTNIDVLSMTATPIPRTLHMSIMGIRDMSVIYEPPKNRRAVQTYVLEYDEEVVKEAILKELERNGQVFYLYNNVEGIEKKANNILSLVKEAKVGYAHGQMSGTELEEIMLNFINKKIDVLVCTTILESGIDIPNANTIIVENADRLGLAQLYQIRGRVGRSNTQAYAYITYKKDKLISEVAEKRLRAIKEFTEFGSGFKIAMRDLEIRGAGSLLRRNATWAHGSSRI